MIQIIQKLIRIGSSEGVTLPRKDLEKLGAKRGDLLKIKVELVNDPKTHDKLISEYQAFVAEYGETLKNLADR